MTSQCIPENVNGCTLKDGGEEAGNGEADDEGQDAHENTSKLTDGEDAV